MDQIELAWRVEAACLNAWPSARQVFLGPWILRLAGGPVRRANSVNPLRASSFDPSPFLADVDQIYQACGLQTLYRVPSFASGMDVVLEAAGYDQVGHSLTLLCHQPGGQISPGAGHGEIAPQPSVDWLDVRAAVHGSDPAAARIFHETTALIALPKAFASWRIDGTTVAIAYGVVHQRLLVIESVATVREARQKGMAGRLVAELMAWGTRQGASLICLQVQADNAPALALYKRLGFNLKLYEYHYRRKRP